MYVWMYGVCMHIYVCVYVCSQDYATCVVSNETKKQTLANGGRRRRLGRIYLVLDNESHIIANEGLSRRLTSHNSFPGKVIMPGYVCMLT